MSNEDLKPCPFCGESDIKEHNYRASPCPDVMHQCESCGATGPGGETIELARMQWNTRNLKRQVELKEKWTAK